MTINDGMIHYRESVEAPAAACGATATLNQSITTTAWRHIVTCPACVALLWKPRTVVQRSAKWREGDSGDSHELS